MPKWWNWQTRHLEGWWGNPWGFKSPFGTIAILKGICGFPAEVPFSFFRSDWLILWLTPWTARDIRPCLTRNPIERIDSSYSVDHSFFEKIAEPSCFLGEARCEFSTFFPDISRHEAELAAILCAGAEGYSRLMGEDEARTLQTLKGPPSGNVLSSSRNTRVASWIPGG